VAKFNSESDRCRDAEQFRKIDAAFRAGNLEALRAAVEDPGSIPNGTMPLAIGPCLEYAIYHSPIAFIRTLLEEGADPNPTNHAGFPPLLAALSCHQVPPGGAPRTDVTEIVALLLSFGADPNQRGINDYTALHMAASVNHAGVVRLLLEAGADPALRTRIDDCETALQLAEKGQLEEISKMLRAAANPDLSRLDNNKPG
jgi:ankyrin repeat protein